MTQKPHVIIAGGGTGGHMFPALAMAKKMAHEGVDVTFATDMRGAAYHKGELPYQVEIIPSDHFVGGVAKKAFSLFANVKGFLKAFKLVYSSKPDVVVGFGGYASFPALLSAIILRVPTIVFQADACFCRTNRILAPYVTKIATAYENIKYIKPEWQSKVVLVGAPVRDEVASLYDLPYPTFAEGKKLHILVIGGSQGAHVFGQVLPEAVKYLPLDLQKQLVISQQCRPENIKAVRASYKMTEASVELSHFFDDMGMRYRDAQLVIARSGASSVAEIACAGRPAVFVPYPHAMDDHQTLNAIAAFDVGGAWVIPQSLFQPEKVAELLQDFFENPWKLNDAAVNMHKLARPDGTDNLIRLTQSLMAVSPETPRIEGDHAL